MLVESCCSGKGINSYESASCPIAMSEQIFYTVQDKTANALSFISLTNSQTPNFNSGIVVTLLAEWNFSIDTIAYTLFSFIQTDDII